MSREPRRSPSATVRARREVQRLSRGLGARLIHAGRVRPAGYDPAKPPRSDVAVFFPDAPERLYQLLQWLPVLEHLNARLTVTVIVRHAASWDEVRPRTTLPVLLAPTYEDLMSLYERAGYRAVLYVNNGLANFQSLAYQPAAHVHVNHGESDKLCMVSNQAKAYDRVFVAGDAAVARHRAALAWFDTDRLQPVGRPQLDLLPEPLLAVHNGPTVVYAPTWEGEDEANNYTSIDRYGPAIAAAALAVEGVRLVYKPHPRIATSLDPAVRAGHEAVVAAIEAAARRAPHCGHRSITDGDVLGVLPCADLLVTDVSSVALDYLYLRPDRPMIVTDRRSDRAALLADSPMAAAVSVLDTTTVSDLPQALSQLLAADPLAPARSAMRTHYFGDFEPGTSLERFESALAQVIAEHELAMKALTRRR